MGEGGTAIECQNGPSVEDCLKKIMVRDSLRKTQLEKFCGICLLLSVDLIILQRKEADAMAVDGGQVYTAGKCGLSPVMVEQYDEGMYLSTDTITYNPLCYLTLST